MKVLFRIPFTIYWLVWDEGFGALALATRTYESAGGHTTSEIRGFHEYKK